MNGSLPGFSVHGIFQARILEWVAMSSSKGSSWPRDWTRSSCICLLHCRGFFYHSATATGGRPKSTIPASHCAHNRMQMPALGHQTLHGVNADHLLSPSFHTLTCHPFCPNTLTLRICFAFPTKETGKHADPLSYSYSLNWLLLIFRHFFLSCYVLSCQTCQSTWHVAGNQKIFVEGRKERNQKGKGEESSSCLLYCERLQNTQNQIIPFFK